MTTIITTTGISLHTNTCRHYGEIENKKITDVTNEQMRHYLRLHPSKASAEANSLEQFANQGDSIVILHTETDKALRCAELLEEYFKNIGHKQVRRRNLPYQENASTMEKQGLRYLVNTIIEEIEAAQKREQEVVINATAGFKAQIVYSTMIGMLYNIPVKYMYEDFKTILTFSPVSLNWDMDIFYTNNVLFDWISKDYRKEHEVENRLKGLPDKEKIRTFLTDSEEGLISLSAVGFALKKQFDREVQETEDTPWPEEVNTKDIDSKIAHAIKNQKHDYPKGMYEACQKIASVKWVERVDSDHFSPVNRSSIQNIYANGVIQIGWAGKDGKTAGIVVKTTAQGEAQTRKIANTIKKSLRIE